MIHRVGTKTIDNVIFLLITTSLASIFTRDAAKAFFCSRLDTIRAINPTGAFNTKLGIIANVKTKNKCAIV
eukprot:evm.model.NODE_23357_length_9358_cov_24.372515.4